MLEMEVMVMEGEPGEGLAFEGVDHGDHQENPGDGADGGEEPGDDFVEPAAEIAGEDAEGDADAEAEDGGEDGDEKSDAGAVEEAPDDGTALDVGAEEQVEIAEARGVVAVGGDEFYFFGEDIGEEGGQADQQVDGDDGQ